APMATTAAIRITMIAMTTRTSMSVKPRERGFADAFINHLSRSCLGNIVVIQIRAVLAGAQKQVAAATDHGRDTVGSTCRVGPVACCKCPEKPRRPGAGVDGRFRGAVESAVVGSDKIAGGAIAENLRRVRDAGSAVIENVITV